MPPRSLRRRDDAERLVRVETLTESVQGTLHEIKEQQSAYYGEVSQTLKEMREAKAREHAALHDRISAVEKEQGSAAGKIAGVAAGAAAAGGFTAWLLNLIRGH